jgi:mRNA interferase RelE/StbE
MAYRVTFKASAEKSLGKLPKEIAARVIEKAAALANDPRPSGSVKLAGPSGLWRVRVGDYRIAYLIDDKEQTVDIRIVAHRRESYRGL